MLAGRIWWHVLVARLFVRGALIFAVVGGWLILLGAASLCHGHRGGVWRQMDQWLSPIPGNEGIAVLLLIALLFFLMGTLARSVN